MELLLVMVSSYLTCLLRRRKAALSASKKSDRLRVPIMTDSAKTLDRLVRLRQNRDFLLSDSPWCTNAAWAWAWVLHLKRPSHSLETAAPLENHQSPSQGLWFVTTSNTSLTPLAAPFFVWINPCVVRSAEESFEALVSFFRNVIFPLRNAERLRLTADIVFMLVTDSKLIVGWNQGYQLLTRSPEDAIPRNNREASRGRGWPDGRRKGLQVRPMLLDINRRSV